MTVIKCPDDASYFCILEYDGRRWIMPQPHRIYHRTSLLNHEFVRFVLDKHFPWLGTKEKHYPWIGV